MALQIASSLVPTLGPSNVASKGYGEGERKTSTHAREYSQHAVAPFVELKKNFGNCYLQCSIFGA